MHRECRQTCFFSDSPYHTNYSQWRNQERGGRIFSRGGQIRDLRMTVPQRVQRCISGGGLGAESPEADARL